MAIGLNDVLQQPLRQVAQVDHAVVAQRTGAFEGVLQFADVTGPVICLDQLAGLVAEPPDAFAQGFVELVKKVRGQGLAEEEGFEPPRASRP